MAEYWDSAGLMLTQVIIKHLVFCEYAAVEDQKHRLGHLSHKPSSLGIILGGMFGWSPVRKWAA